MSNFWAFSKISELRWVVNLQTCPNGCRYSENLGRKRSNLHLLLWKLIYLAKILFFKTRVSEKAEILSFFSLSNFKGSSDNKIILIQIVSENGEQIFLTTFLCIWILFSEKKIFIGKKTVKISVEEVKRRWRRQLKRLKTKIGDKMWRRRVLEVRTFSFLFLWWEDYNRTDFGESERRAFMTSTSLL